MAKANVFDFRCQCPGDNSRFDGNLSWHRIWQPSRDADSESLSASANRIFVDGNDDRHMGILYAFSDAIDRQALYLCGPCAW